MSYDPGKLNRRIQIQQPTHVPNDAGESVTSWTTIRTTWGNIRPVGATEAVRNQAMESRATHVVTVRYTANVDSTCRVTVDGRTFEIDGAIDVQDRHEWLQLNCHEVTP